MICPANQDLVIDSRCAINFLHVGMNDNVAGQQQQVGYGTGD